MSKDYRKEAQNEDANRGAIRAWIASRIEQIHAHVTAHDVLRRNGVELKQGGSDREEQFSCPFHGKDTKPSGRVYPSSARGPSHVWCFVCQERWDAITLWKKFSGFEGKFTALLGCIERDFGLPTPEAPPEGIEEPEDDEARELEDLFGVCERRLRTSKAAFNMRGFLKVGSVLDKLYAGVENGSVGSVAAKAALQKVLGKITEKAKLHDEAG